MDKYLAIILIILAFIGGGAVTALWKDYTRTKTRLRELEQASDRRHLPYNVADNLEDALAMINRLKRIFSEPIEALDNIEGHLKNARNNRK